MFLMPYEIVTVVLLPRIDIMTQSVYWWLLIIKPCSFGGDSLLVVLFIVYDGECAIELFQEEKAAHFMGQSETGE